MPNPTISRAEDYALLLYYQHLRNNNIPRDESHLGKRDQNHWMKFLEQHRDHRLISFREINGFLNTTTNSQEVADGPNRFVEITVCGKSDGEALMVYIVHLWVFNPSGPKFAGLYWMKDGETETFY